MIKIPLLIDNMATFKLLDIMSLDLDFQAFWGPGKGSLFCFDSPVLNYPGEV